MAKIESGDLNDIQKANAWILRARNGLENKMWVCFISNKSQKRWSSTSDSGYFNSLEWKQPIMLDRLNDNNFLMYEN